MMEDRGIEWVIAAAKCAAFALALAGAAALCSCHGPQVAQADDVAVGQPLDATRYAAPSFSDGEYSLLVVDRGCMRRWWVVQVEGQQVVLPLGEVGP